MSGAGSAGRGGEIAVFLPNAAMCTRGQVRAGKIMQLHVEGRGIYHFLKATTQGLPAMKIQAKCMQRLKTATGARAFSRN